MATIDDVLTSFLEGRAAASAVVSARECPGGLALYSDQTPIALRTPSGLLQVTNRHASEASHRHALRLHGRLRGRAPAHLDPDALAEAIATEALERRAARIPVPPGVELVVMAAPLGTWADFENTRDAAEAIRLADERLSKGPGYQHRHVVVQWRSTGLPTPSPMQLYENGNRHNDPRALHLPRAAGPTLLPPEEIQRRWGLFPPAEVLEHLRAFYLEGTRVRAVQFHYTPGDWVDDNTTVPAGTEGTVADVADDGQVKVNWDNGARLGAHVLDRDEIEVLDFPDRPLP
jgi:Domain of unknown function (DUF4314)